MNIVLSVKKYIMYLSILPSVLLVEIYYTQYPNLNTPRCPTCRSTNIKKISAARKVTGVALFGLFSKTAKSQFECGSCGYKW